MGGSYGANRCLDLHNQAINTKMRNFRPSNYYCLEIAIIILSSRRECFNCECKFYFFFSFFFFFLLRSLDTVC